MSNLDICISIIIPCYNAEQYISDCLDSILKIENLPIEIICIDDGSTDDTWSILEAYKENDSRIILLQQKNLYAGRARNAGMKIAKGRYITFIDADDMLYSTETLLKAYEEAVAEDCDFFGCGAVFGNSIQKTFTQKWILNKEHLPKQKVFSAQEMGCFTFSTFGGAPWAKLYKKSFLEANHLEFPGLPRTEDICFVEPAIALAKKISYTEDVLIFHRYGIENSLENTKDETPTIFWEASMLVCAKMQQLGLLEKFKAPMKLVLIERSLYNLEWMKTVEGFTAVFDCVRDKVLPFINSLDVSIANADYEAATQKLGEYLKYSSGYEYLYAQLSKQKQIINETQGKLAREKRECAQLREKLHLQKAKKPKVSVVIPAYNVAPYLEACLESVIHQTLEEIEIICVNDGSTDNSLDILKQYSAMDARILVVNFKENKGVSEARNAGAQKATGEYLYFIDSDDLVVPEAMEELYNKAKKEMLDVLCFEGTTFFETKELEKRCSWSKQWCVRSREYSGIKTGKQIFAEMYPNNDYKCPVWILFINREFYVKEKLNFATDIKVIEDVLFTFECIIKAKRAAHSFKKYYVRRVRENSLTSVANRKFKHPYGFFQVAMRIMKLACTMDLDAPVAAATSKEITRMLLEGGYQFPGMASTEIQKYKDLPESEKVLFERLMLEPFNKEQERVKLQEKLKQTENLLTAIKKEIDSQKITANKASEEKQSALKELDSLAKKYEAQSTEVKKIAGKLKTTEANLKQTTNKLKAIEADLKQTTDKLKTTEKELREASKNLNNVKSGYSFRIGRIFTYLPRLLTGKKY